MYLQIAKTKQVNQRGLYDNILLVVKGLAMQVKQSTRSFWGIVAIVTGFYPEFLFSLKRLNFNAFFMLITGKFKQFYRYTNTLFLSLIALGIVLSYFTVSRVLDIALIRYEQYVKALFFGMVVMSVLVLIIDFKKWELKFLLFSFIGLRGHYTNVFRASLRKQNLFFVFFCGFVSTWHDNSWTFWFFFHSFGKLCLAVGRCSQRSLEIRCRAHSESLGIQCFGARV